ncbi:MAG: hypothetical protein ACXVCP_09780 [Bdellovibrio sp.]
MKKLLKLIYPLLISSTTFAANKVYTVENLFEIPGTLVSCKDQTRNDPKDILYTIHKDGGKLVGTAIKDDKSDVEAYVKRVPAAPNSYGNYLTWQGQDFEISINLDISNSRNYDGKLSSSLITNGYADYTDDEGNNIHSALYCMVKKEVVK